MKTTSKLHRTLQVLFITGFSIFALASAYATEAPKVNANNYVRAESDIQMTGYIESYKNFGKFEHFRKGFPLDNHVTVRGNLVTLYSFGVFDLSTLKGH